jgi:putative ABC transport system permease protein
MKSSSPAWYRYLRFWRRDVPADIDAELRFHFEARIEELMVRGLSRDAARAQATEEFGDVDAVRRGLREIDDRVARRHDRAEWLDGVRKDVVYAARSLRRTPAVSLTIILTLALGLGVNAAMFSLLDVIFLRAPAGVAHPERVRRLWSERPTVDGRQFHSIYDYSSYDALVAAIGTQVDLAVYGYPGQRALSTDENPPMATVSGANDSYFDVLGVHPELGRFFSREEDRIDAPAPVVVISDAFWRRHFGGDTHVIGKILSIAGSVYGAPGLLHYTIIGVAPPHFSGVDLDAVDIWRPIASTLPTLGGIPWYRNPNINGLQIVLRLHPGVSEAELEQRATARLRGPDVWFGQDTLTVAQFGSILAARGPGKLDSSVQVATRLAGVAIIVLIIACANVVNLLLARAVRRRREIAVRLALGVSRARLVRLLVTESVLLAAIAAAAALLAAWWGGALLRTLLLPRVHWGESVMAWRVLTFGLVVALVAGALTGLVPALQSLAPDLTDALKAGARSGAGHRSRVRSTLVVVQAALSVVLLVGAALFIESLDNVRSRDIGYAVDQLGFVQLRNEGVDTTTRRVQSNRLLALEPRFASIPGVKRVAYASMQPLYGITWEEYYPQARTSTEKLPLGLNTAVTSDFFATSGTRILRGRGFTSDGHTNGSYEVIVNDAMARALWPGASALGKCIHFVKRDAPCAVVVGVAQTAMLEGVREDPSPHFYLPLEHMPFPSWGVGSVILRVDPDRMPSVLATMHTLLRAEFPTVFSKSTTMAESMEPLYRPWRLGATLFTLFGVLALVVAGIGVYSSVSYAVSQRTHEFGVRAALGATARDVVQHVLGTGLRAVIVGIASGVMLALIAGRLVASLLYGVKPDDIVALSAAAATLLAIAVIAALVPAWRASRVDPVEALRTE